MRDGVKEEKERGEGCREEGKWSKLKGQKDGERGWLTVRRKIRNKLAHAKVREMLSCNGKNKSHEQGENNVGALIMHNNVYMHKGINKNTPTISRGTFSQGLC